MEFELWWLLSIPLFFALGWIAARIDITQLLSESRTLPKNYFKGLNSLLNDQTDRAVDAFIEIVKLDPEAVDMHFALGHLFRRRGETERAIRVHQNLLSRPDLGSEWRHQAQFELGQDFLKAGLLDRAEAAFHALSGTTYHSQAGRALLEIYQREKSWEKAIEAAQSLQQIGAGERHREISQFYCELAHDRLVSNEPEAARTLLGTALSNDRNSVRATIMLGDLDAAADHHEAAIQHWRRVEHQSVPHVALVAQRLMDAYRHLGRTQGGLMLLRSYLSEASSIDLLDVLYKAVLELEGVEAVNQLVSEDLRRTPTLLGLEKLLDARLMKMGPDAHGDMVVVKNLIHNYTQKLARYQCTHCGFKARQFYWHCPGCSSWDSYPPRRTEELNVMS